VGPESAEKEKEFEMKLYYSPGACSLHPLITIHETGLPVELVRVDLRAHKTETGADYYAVNPKGYVPALQFDDGTTLTEGAVIDQYLADQKPETKMLPPAGTMDRYRVLEWLNFVSSEIHKTFSPMFGGSDVVKEHGRTKLARRFDIAAKALDEHPYLVGDTFSVADAYLFNMLTWTPFMGIDLARWPALQAFFARVQQRPAVQAAVAAHQKH
jgi:glutathione S-transferase